MERHFINLGIIILAESEVEMITDGMLFFFGIIVAFGGLIIYLQMQILDYMTDVTEAIDDFIEIIGDESENIRFVSPRKKMWVHED